MEKGLALNVIDELFLKVGSQDDATRMAALNRLLEITEGQVDWFDARVDELTRKLDHENSYQRSIGIMLLCSLAKSDTGNRIPALLPRILSHTRDEKFITSRQCIQSIWKVAVTNPATKAAILGHLKAQYISCINEKHYNLIRHDIIQSLYAVYQQYSDADLRREILELIEKEADPRYRANYKKIIK